MSASGVQRAQTGEVIYLPHSHDGVCDEYQQDHKRLHKGCHGFFSLFKPGQHLQEHTDGTWTRWASETGLAGLCEQEHQGQKHKAHQCLWREREAADSTSRPGGPGGSAHRPFIFMSPTVTDLHHVPNTKGVNTRGNNSTQEVHPRKQGQHTRNDRKRESRGRKHPPGRTDQQLFKDLEELSEETWHGYSQKNT